MDEFSFLKSLLLRVAAKNECFSHLYQGLVVLKQIF